MRGAILLSKRSRHLSLLVGALAVVSLLQAASAAALEPSSNAKARGCRTGGVHDINRVQPEWTSVRRGDAAQVAEGVVRSSNVAYHDFPFSHVSHDWNWDLLPDPAYQFLNGTDNGRVGSSRQMEIEWEEAFFPSAFRPAVGDRAWMLGRWVFDCGHSPYLTEIHPPKAVAHTRFAPTILPGDSAPSLTNKTFIWIHGRGGYYNRSVARQDYDFDITLPPKPQLTVQQSKAHGAAVAPPVAFGAEPARAILARVGSVTPVLSYVPAGNPTKVHVHYPLAAVRDSNPSRQFGAIIAAGWREQNLGRTYRQLCVKFENIRVLHDHDPLASGEWRLRLFAGQQWTPLSSGVNSRLNDVDDGETVPLHAANDNRCAAIFNVTDPGGSVRIETTGWESDPIDGLFGSGGNILRLADDNDQIGVVRRVFSSSANFGIGPHSDLSSSGDFRLRYVISELRRFGAGTAVR